jgi:hypothetical protein
MTTTVQQVMADEDLPDFRAAGFSEAWYGIFKRHLLERIAQTPEGEKPFRHLYISNVLHDDLYSALLARMIEFRRNQDFQERRQDSALYVNRRRSLAKEEGVEVQYVIRLFSDRDVKRALLAKFYLDASDEFVDSLKIHRQEFEFTFTGPNLKQDVHVDIPAKFLSCVFYFPEVEPTAEEARLNGTVLYDKALRPAVITEYRPNSVGIFAPHFYSYHGFATTINRQALVLFYNNDRRRFGWLVAKLTDRPPFKSLKSGIASKLAKHPLIEYGADRQVVEQEMSQCLVNAPQGRVKID